MRHNPIVDRCRTHAQGGLQGGMPESRRARRAIMNGGKFLQKNAFRVVRRLGTAAEGYCRATSEKG